MSAARKQVTESKESRAVEIIKSRPTWTRARIQEQLRGEFGSGLRYESYGRLRGEILSAGSIGEYRRRKLIKEGFLPSEARMLAGVAISSPLMQRYIRERRAVVRVARDVGMPRKDLSTQIRFQYRTEGFYKKGKVQPLKRMVEWTRQRYSLDEAAVVEQLGAGAIREWLPRGKRGVLRKWLAAGFLKSESLEFLKAKNWRKLVVSSPGRAARRERRRWVDDLRRRGWTDRQIRKEMRAYYQRDITRSPWDFIRKYKPKVRKDFRIYARAQEERAEQLQEKVGAFYRRARRG